MKKAVLIILTIFCLEIFAQPIIINTLPKSGSMFILHNLADQLKGGMKSYHEIAHQSFPKDSINISKLLMLLSRDRITQSHFDASDRNIKLLKRYCPRMILNVRDVRQATLSWVHHLDKHLDNPEMLKMLLLPLPNNYGSLSFEEKLDWNIDHYLPSCIKWIEDWLDVEKEQSLEILVTTYENLLEDQLGFFQDIYDFYNIPYKVIDSNMLKPSKSLHFRNGTSDEWVYVFTREQKERATSLIPEDLFERFQWIR